MRKKLPQSAPPTVSVPADSKLKSETEHKKPPRKKPNVSHFDQLPDSALIGISSVAVVLGKGVSTLWRDIKTDADFPKSIRLSPGCTRFKVGDIRAYLDKKTSASHDRHPARKVKP